MKLTMPLLLALLVPAVLGFPGHALHAQPDLRNRAAGPASPVAASRKLPPLRLALAAPRVPPARLCTHLYEGGFAVKFLMFETLVTRDAEGRIAPGLATAWEFLDGGKSAILTLRKGAVFHDGRPVDAAIVRWNIQCWAGRPGHSWLPAARHIQRVTVPSPGRVRIDMDRAYALLPDLCSMNPTGILGGGSVNAKGFYETPVGSGPFRFLEAREEGRVLCLTRYRHGKPDLGEMSRVDIIVFPEDDPDAAVDGLLADEVDLLVDTWLTRVSRPRIAALEKNPDFRVTEAPGGPVMVLQFNLRNGPAADREFRLKIRSLIDRAALIRAIECGHADPCYSWAAPTAKVWPRSRVRTEPTRTEDAPPIDLKAPLRLLIEKGKARVAEAVPHVVKQLERGGLEVKVLALDGADLYRALSAGEYDVQLDRTFGVPYDPYISLVYRLLPPEPEGGNGSPKPGGAAGGFSELRGLVDEVQRLTDIDDRIKVYRKVQDLMDREAAVIPLYVARRVAVVRAGLEFPGFGPDVYRLDLDPVLVGR